MKLKTLYHRCIKLTYVNITPGAAKSVKFGVGGPYTGVLNCNRCKSVQMCVGGPYTGL